MKKNKFILFLSSTVLSISALLGVTIGNANYSELNAYEEAQSKYQLVMSKTSNNLTQYDNPNNFLVYTPTKHNPIRFTAEGAKYTKDAFVSFPNGGHLTNQYFAKLKNKNRIDGITSIEIKFGGCSFIDLMYGWEEEFKPSGDLSTLPHFDLPSNTRYVMQGEPSYIYLDIDPGCVIESITINYMCQKSYNPNMDISCFTIEPSENNIHKYMITGYQYNHDLEDTYIVFPKFYNGVEIEMIKYTPNYNFAPHYQGVYIPNTIIIIKDNMEMGGQGLFQTSGNPLYFENNHVPQTRSDYILEYNLMEGHTSCFLGDFIQMEKDNSMW